MVRGNRCNRPVHQAGGEGLQEHRVLRDDDIPQARTPGLLGSAGSIIRYPLENTKSQKIALELTKKVRTIYALTCENTGASNQTRTDDPRFTRAVLYQLSYAGLRLSAQLLYGDAPGFASVSLDFSMDSLTDSTIVRLCQDALHDPKLQIPID